MKVELQVFEGPAKDRSFTFDQPDTFVFGRAEGVHCCVDDSYVSRNHFMIEVVPPRCRLRDLGSKNGTRVNGVCHKSGQPPSQGTVELRHGDVVDVGRTRLRVVLVLGQCRECSRDLSPADGGEYCGACRGRAETTGPAPETLSLHKAEPRHPDAGPPGYHLEHLVGEGRMGCVWRARHAASARPVAVKSLALARPSPRAVAEFRREADVLRELRHPNVVEFIEAVSPDGNALFLVMEFVDGPNLQQLLDGHGGKLTVAQTVPLMRQMLDGIAYAHGQGVVHRDLKPANVLVERVTQVAKIGDFGLAKSYLDAGISGMTDTGESAGTPKYMCAEQVLHYRDCGPPADLYSLGATIYQMLSGDVPNDFPPGRDPFLVILQDPPVPLLDRNPAVPPGLARVVDRSVAACVSDRFATAADIRAALEDVV